MSNIHLKVDDVQLASAYSERNALKLSNLCNEIASVATRVDWEIKARNRIGTRSQDINRKLQDTAQRLRRLNEFLTKATAKYCEADDYLFHLALYELSTDPLQSVYGRLQLDPGRFLQIIGGSLDFSNGILNSEDLLMVKKNFRFKLTNKDGKVFITLAGASMTTPGDYIEYRNLLIRNFGGESGTYIKRYVERLINGGGIPIYTKETGVIQNNFDRYSSLEPVSRYIGGQIDPWGTMGTAFNSSFVDGLKFWDDFNWKNNTTLTKGGKLLGALGTGITVTGNFIESFYDPGSDSWDFKDGENMVDFGVNTAVDIGSGAVSMATGAAVGSLIVPPLGTIVGAGVGIGVNVLINVEFGDPPASVVARTKEIANKAVDALIDGGKRTIETIDHFLDDASQAVGDYIDGIGTRLNKIFW